MKTFGEQFKEERLSRKLTQEQAAAETLVNISNISHIENNKPVELSLEKIEFAFNYFGFMITKNDAIRIKDGVMYKEPKSTEELKKEFIPDINREREEERLREENIKLKRLVSEKQQIIDTAKQNVEEQLNEYYDTLDKLETDNRDLMEKIRCGRLKQYNIDSLIDKFRNGDYKFNEGISEALKTVKQTFDGYEVMELEEVEPVD